MPNAPLDLAAYVARVGYRGPLTHSLETLVGLHRAQAFRIPFENLDIHLNRPIGLEPASLVQKLVHEQRGGYCYEANGLFRLVLQELGFAVTCLVGRNLLAGPPLRPRAHQVLLVEVEGQPWLADLGFGANGLIEPIPLEAGPEHQQFFDRYRLQAAPQHNYHLQLQMQGQWQSLYTFTLDEAQPSDFQMMNFYYSQAPDSPFRKQRITTLATPDGRISLIDRELKIRRADGSTSTTPVTSDAAYEQTLATHFGIRLPAALPI
ncbi:arylamine N-acetyltransferase family protein [Hymenobacter arizonensis]|uniref:N-hydroxyarylamine O-acetyltransferase n=1 Tax=Hymenobacter arizonensis TaxID=1227077 RepID=A0A1I5UTK9_HYMAR|nr:arylamine N-acetyltransferase [Hymenobacter arizonensis]SFP98530.1 N-hydroxyarylamine O-acetyltransferase [Hymenobacter arizonensis]